MSGYPLSNDEIHRLLCDDFHYHPSLPVGSTFYTLFGCVSSYTLADRSQVAGEIVMVPHYVPYEMILKELMIYIATPASLGTKQVKLLVYHNVVGVKGGIFADALAYESPDLDASGAGTIVGVSGLTVPVGPGYILVGTWFSHAGTNPDVRKMSRSSLANRWGWNRSLLTTAYCKQGLSDTRAYGPAPDPFPVADQERTHADYFPAIWGRLELA